jgi:prophage antirepressor-like protein
MHVDFTSIRSIKTYNIVSESGAHRLLLVEAAVVSDINWLVIFVI